MDRAAPSADRGAPPAERAAPSAERPEPGDLPEIPVRSSPARAESPRPVLAPSKVPQRAPSFPEISSRYVFQAEADTAKEEGTSPLGHKASLSARLRSKVEKE